MKIFLNKKIFSFVAESSIMILTIFSGDMMSKNIEEKDRLYPVTKGNQLIQNSRYNLSLQQQKLVAYAISKIKPRQDSFEWLDISVQDFNTLCGKTGNPGSNDYLLFRDSIMGLSETFFLEELETDENGNAKRDKNGNLIKRTSNVNWFDFELEERINSKGETVASKGRIKLNEKLNRHLIGLKGVYTQYSLQYILPMKSKFSIRLYEYIKSYSNLAREIEFDLEELKDVLLSENDGVRDPNKYRKFSDFQRRILEPAIEEINRFTDIRVKILSTKTYKRNVYAVVFGIEMAVQVLDRDKNPIQAQTETGFAMPEGFSYVHGSSKPVFKREMLKRVFVVTATEIQAEIWQIILNRYATLANRHSKGDRRIDGGNVQYIDLFNEMYARDKLDYFAQSQINKYAGVEFQRMLDERNITNRDAYLRGCVRNDVENWQEFLRAEQNRYSEQLNISGDDFLGDITPPVFEKP